MGVRLMRHEDIQTHIQGLRALRDKIEGVAPKSERVADEWIAAGRCERRHRHSAAFGSVEGQLFGLRMDVDRLLRELDQAIADHERKLEQAA